MYAYFKALVREACKCGVKTKGRLEVMGSKPDPICSKCFRDFNRSLCGGTQEEYDY